MPSVSRANVAPVTSPAQALDELFKDVDRSGAPGLSVGVMHRGILIYRKGFGLASIEHGVVNTPATLMRIGSTTKHFTCLAALLLAEEGKLEIDAPVRRYIPELPALEYQPTLRQLMTHTGGIRDYLDLTLIANGLGFQPVGSALAAQVRQSEANFAPAVKMMYCNGGYHLLSICIERASDVSFEQFLSERIFKPMGMVDTVAAPSDMDIRRGMATLHIPTPSGGFRRGLFPSEEVRGAGSVISTVDDMLRWAAHLRAPNKPIVSPESWRQLLTPTYLVDGTPTTYGLGLMLHEYRGVRVIHHSGSVMGGTSQMLTVPEHELDVVILGNGSHVNSTVKANRVVDILLEHHGLGAAGPFAQISDYAPLHGVRYRSATSGMVLGFQDVAFPEGNAKQLGLSILGFHGIAMTRTGDILTVPVHETSLGPFSLSIATLPTDAAAPDHIVVKEGSVSERFDRLPAVAPGFSDLASNFIGQYRSNDLNAVGSFELDGDAEWTFRVVGAVGTMAYKLQPYADDCIRAESTDLSVPLVAIITIERGATGVRALYMDTPRSRRIRFEKKDQND